MELAMNFAQCYYTSQGGWSAVGSPDLPSAAKLAFSAAQATNAPRSQHYLDASGKPLYLLEVSGDSSYLFMTGCRYGIVDVRGRPNMFAHGYCASWTKAMIEDPAEVCFIDPKSFAMSKEEVNFNAQPVTHPIHGFMNAMQFAGFAWNNFAMLTLAIYAVCERPDSPSLYLINELEGQKQQALMYCIYLSMPYSLRTKLSFANAAVPNAKPKTVIFCKPGTVPAGAHYFNLSTGENNVVTAEWMKKNKKNQFMRYFGSYGGRDEAQVYFKQLDARLQQLGKPGSASYKLLYLADILMTMDQGKQPEADDLSLLYTMLTTPTANDIYLDGYLAVILDRLLNDNVELNEELQTSVWERLRATQNERMIETRMRYRRRELLKMPQQKAADELLDMRQHVTDGAMQKREFEEAQAYLFETKEGREIIGLAVRDEYVQMKDKSFAALEDVYGDCKQLDCDAKTVNDFVLAQAYELYCTELLSLQPVDALKHYRSFVSRCFAPETVESCMIRAKQRYWDLFDLTMIDVNKSAEYTAMMTPHNNSRKAKDYALVYNKVQVSLPDDKARMYLIMLNEGDLNEKERNFLYREAKSVCTANYEPELSDSSALIRLAAYASKTYGTGMLTALAEMEIAADVYTWQRILQSAPCFMEDGELVESHVDNFVNSIQASASKEANEAEKKLYESIQTAYQSIAAEKKQLEKQAIKAQKEELRQQRKDQVGSAFSKIGAMIGKKNDAARQSELPAQEDDYTVTKERDYPAAEQTPVWGADEAAEDVIYSGRDLSQMSETPAISGESYAEEASAPKKKKVSDFFNKFKK